MTERRGRARATVRFTWIALLLLGGLWLVGRTSNRLAAQQAPAGDSTAIPTATWTPFVVTNTPTPENVFIAAALVLEQTAQASSVGTATPTPVNLVTATPTPTYHVVTNTPTAQNAATATYMARRATAEAITTGTVDPNSFVTATNTPGVTPTPTHTAPPPPTATPTPSPKPPPATATPTPVFILLEDLPIKQTPTPQPTLVFPEPLVGKVLFLSNLRDGKVRVYAMNPDGTGLAQLTNGWPYKRAEERDAYSPAREYRAFALKEDQFGTRGKVQIFYDFYEYGTVDQVTFFGAGTAWAPSWSPTADKIAFVSNESGNDEIWVVERGQWPAIQLTQNEWEWDHHPSWSPDGTQIVFSSNRSGRRQIWIMNADGGNPQPLTPFDWEAWDPVWVKYPDS